ncbi:MAG: fatty acid desaturase [Solirubrobacterales bacterium]
MEAATATATEAPEAPVRKRPFWYDGLAPYMKPSLRLSILDLLTSVVPFIAGWVAMYLALDVGYWLSLIIAIPTAGFLLCTFIVFHDCTHLSFMPTKRQNHIVGVFTGLLVFTPFARWGHQHAVHHGTAGDIERRGTGDVETATLGEYREMTPKQRALYRAFRNPAVMFTIGPIYSMLVMPRIVPKDARPRIKNSVILTNIALAVVIAGLCVLVGPLTFLMLEFPVILMAGMAGVWLFYVQHQFEDVYWENSDDWSYADAALRGSSYLKLPKIMQWFSGNIGLHHIHHLSAKVPNYHLQAAHDNNDIFDDVPVLTFWSSFRCTRFKLIDEDTGRLLTWAEVRALEQAAPATELG